MISIENKVAAVTGGASGIGYRYVEELLRKNSKHVAIIDSNISAGEEASKKLKAIFGEERVIFLRCDVSDDKQVKDCLKRVTESFNGLDILINNAGILNDKRWQMTVEINVIGVIRCTLAGYEYMSIQNGGKGGTIVNVSSIVGLYPADVLPVYCASKHAVLGFSRSIQGHYERTGVRVLVLCPGATITPMLDNPADRVLDIVDGTIAVSRLAKLPSQSAQHVALSMMKLIEIGENGAVWVVENSQPPYALTFPHYSTFSTPVQDA